MAPPGEEVAGSCVTWKSSGQKGGFGGFGSSFSEGKYFFNRAPLREGIGGFGGFGGAF
jgi:hypothetical protein